MGTKYKFAGIRTYDHGAVGNMQEVLGKRWILAILCPFLASPLLGDGQRFEVSAHAHTILSPAENVKNM
jgi:hypothetical protein